MLFRTFRNLIMMNRDKIPYSIKRSSGKNPLTCPFNVKMEQEADLRPRYNDQQERCFGVIDYKDFERHFLTKDDSMGDSPSVDGFFKNDIPVSPKVNIKHSNRKSRQPEVKQENTQVTQTIGDDYYDEEQHNDDDGFEPDPVPQLTGKLKKNIETIDVEDDPEPEPVPSNRQRDLLEEQAPMQVSKQQQQYQQNQYGGDELGESRQGRCHF